jgi:hypothetical protein
MVAYSLRWSPRALNEGLHQFDICLDVRIRSEPSLISNQNAVSGAMNQQPKAVHVTKFGKQSLRRWNISSLKSGQIVVAHSNQVPDLVADKLAEAF